MKTKSVDERLNDFLGIENEIKETSQELVVKANNDIQEYQEEKNEQRQKDIENDYDFHRHNLHDLVEKGQDTLNNLIELAKQSEVTCGLREGIQSTSADILSVVAHLLLHSRFHPTVY